MVTAPLWSNRIVAVTAATHPIAQCGTRSWADLQDATFLIGKDDIGRELGALLERKMRQAGYVPHMRPEAMRSLRVIAVVANSEDIALLPDAWLAFLPASIRERIAVVDVVDGDGFPHFAYGAAWRQEICPPAARRVISFLEQQAVAF